MMAIVSPMLVERTERGDRDVHDDDRAALPACPRHRRAGRRCPSRRRRNRCSPTADDEGTHEPADEPLWSESWYFDFADPGQGVGGWLRLGLIPNQGSAWINALLCGPDMPTIAVLDFEAALPDDATHGRHRRDRPHPRGDRAAADLPGVDCAVAAQAYDDPAGPAAGRTRPTGRAGDGPGVDHGGHAVPVPADAALRDPVHGVGHGGRRRTRARSGDGAGPARPLVGSAGLVEHGLGVERTAPRRTAPTCTASTCASPERRR